MGDLSFSLGFLFIYQGKTEKIDFEKHVHTPESLTATAAERIQFRTLFVAVWKVSKG
jgi:hypothetical protein